MIPSVALVALLLAAPAAQPAARESGPDRALAYYHYSLGQQAGRTEQALEELRKAQRYDPGAGVIRAEIARLLRELGRPDEALEAAKEGVRLAPESADARRVLAQLLRDLAQSGVEPEDDAQGSDPRPEGCRIGRRCYSNGRAGTGAAVAQRCERSGGFRLFKRYQDVAWKEMRPRLKLIEN